MNEVQLNLEKVTLKFKIILCFSCGEKAFYANQHSMSNFKGILGTIMRTKNRERSQLSFISTFLPSATTKACHST